MSMPRGNGKSVDHDGLTIPILSQFLVVLRGDKTPSFVVYNCPKIVA